VNYISNEVYMLTKIFNKTTQFRMSFVEYIGRCMNYILLCTPCGKIISEVTLTFYETTNTEAKGGKAGETSKMLRNCDAQEVGRTSKKQTKLIFKNNKILYNKNSRNYKIYIKTYFFKIN